jgi:hypothetical protein
VVRIDERGEEDSYFKEIAFVCAPVVIFVATLALLLESLLHLRPWSPTNWKAFAGAVAPGPKLIAAALLMAAIVLLLTNTVVFSTSVSKNWLKSTSACWQRNAAQILTLVSMAVLAIWLYYLYNSGPGEHDEYLALSVFLLFTIIDGLLIKDCRDMARLTRRSLATTKWDPDHPRDIKDREVLVQRLEDWPREKWWHDKQLYCVDLPPLLGIACIIYFGNAIIPHVKFDSDPAINQAMLRSFVFAFSCGSLVMHLILSQIVYLALAIDYVNQKHRKTGTL